jgi:hypothetical protein
MKLSLLFEGWEELGIEDPNLSGYKWAYANVAYHHNLDIKEVLELVKRLLSIRGYSSEEISLVPGTIEANEDDLDHHEMKTIEVDVKVEPKFFGDLDRVEYINLSKPLPSWMPGYQEEGRNLIEVEFEAELNS